MWGFGRAGLTLERENNFLPADLAIAANNDGLLTDLHADFFSRT